jgi:hypothetical protein
MYQIGIHILTTGVSGMEEPRARWTHLNPDDRLTAFATVHKGIPDMKMVSMVQDIWDGMYLMIQRRFLMKIILKLR